MSEGTTRDPERLENEALRRRVAALEAEAERFRTTLYSIGDAVIATDAGGLIVQMNPVAEQLTGWSEAEARGRPLDEIFRIVNEETRATVESPARRVLRDGQVVGLANHTLLMARDGKEWPIADSGAPIRDEHGEVTGMVLVFRDRTEERAAQRALLESERKFRDTITHLDEGYYSVTVDGLIIDHNLAFNRVLGFDDSVDLKGQPSPNFWQDPDDRKEYLARLMAEGVIANYKVNAKTHHGDKIVVLLHSHLVRDDRGQLTRIEGAVTDYTERQRMEETLEESEEKYRGLFDNAERRVLERTQDLARSKQLSDETARLARVGGWELDLESNKLRWTDVVHQIHEVGPGYRPTLEAGINFYAPEALPVISEAMRRAIEEGQPFDLELQLITAKKNWIWVRAVGEAIREDGRIAKVRGVFQDINERKLAGLELKKHREHLGELVEQRTAELKESQQALVEAQKVARLGSWEWDAVKDVITGSAEFHRLFEVAPEQIAQFAQFVERIHPDDRERVQRDVADALKQDRPYDTDYQVKLRDGGWRDINARGRVFADADGKPVRMVGTCLDITERNVDGGEKARRIGD